MAKWMRVPVVSLLTALIMSVGGQNGVSHATIDPTCTQEDGIFWGATNSSHQWRYRYGTDNNILITDRGLNSNCNGYPYWTALSTSHIDFSLDPNDLIEIGIREGWVGGSHQFWWFSELYVMGNLVDLHTAGLGSWPCSWPGVGHRLDFRVSSFQGTTNWALKIDCHDGAGLQTVRTYNNTNAQTGIPEAETSRQGGVSTGMSDDQNNLQYRAFSYSDWLAWTGLACMRDFENSGTNNWNGEQAGAPDLYDTYKSSTDNCPPP